MTIKNCFGILLVLACAITNAPAWATQASPSESNMDAKAFYNRGTEFYGKENYEAAVQDLSKAIELEPKAPDAYFNRGLSYQRLHQTDEALADLSKAIQLYPYKAGYYFERCNARIVKNDLDGAISDCSEAIQLSPNEADGYFMRGIAYTLKGDLYRALADSAQAFEIQPNHLGVRRLLYEALVKREAIIINKANLAHPSSFSSAA